MPDHATHRHCALADAHKCPEHAACVQAVFSAPAGSTSTPSDNVAGAPNSWPRLHGARETRRRKPMRPHRFCGKHALSVPWSCLLAWPFHVGKRNGPKMDRVPAIATTILCCAQVSKAIDGFILGRIGVRIVQRQWALLQLTTTSCPLQSHCLNCPTTKRTKMRPAEGPRALLA